MNSGVPRMMPVAVSFASWPSARRSFASPKSITTARTPPPSCPPTSMMNFGLAKRSEEHTSELQSLAYLVCRLLLEKKKKNTQTPQILHHIEKHSSPDDAT